MKNKSYSVTIDVALSAIDVFSYINDVSKWWSKEFEGQRTNLNDELILCEH